MSLTEFEKNTVVIKDN